MSNINDEIITNNDLIFFVKEILDTEDFYAEMIVFMVYNLLFGDDAVIDRNERANDLVLRFLLDIMDKALKEAL